jgi:hypothetical protein
VGLDDEQTPEARNGNRRFRRRLPQLLTELFLQ